MAETIPGAELAVIPDAGHSPQFENPAAWLDVLQQLPRRAAPGITCGLIGDPCGSPREISAR